MARRVRPRHSNQIVLSKLKEAGLGSLPGTAAEISTMKSLSSARQDHDRPMAEVVETAHTLGVKTTATIMFGHVDHYRHWARHLLHIRDLQSRTGGFTEFVPLPFVPTETPLHLKGLSRLGPTYREAVLILTSIGSDRGAAQLWFELAGQLEDAMEFDAARWAFSGLGGTLMNESITRAAGALHGEETPEIMEQIISALGRQPRQRTTLYGDAPPERVAASFSARPLQRTMANVAPKSADCI